MTPEDIKRINYIKYSSFRQFVKNPHSLITCYVLFFLRLMISILRLEFYYKKIGRVLFYVPSSNNKKSVKTIIENLQIDGITVYGTRRTDLPTARFYLTSLHGLHLFQKLYNSSSKEDKQLMRQFYLSFMNTYGIYLNFERIIKENPQLKLIVLANDHITTCRCWIELAEKYGIKTIYVQHASITERFPPLHFSYSFLDGMESYEKYKVIGDMHGKVFLTGSPRFDELYSYKGIIKKYDIGIALNPLDSCDKALELCQYLQENITKQIIVRPHPRMGKLFEAQRFLNAGYDVSDPAQESSFSFLSKVKFLIANESSIHLDSALIGVPSLLFNFSTGEVRDWYSYIRKGLIQVCESKIDVAEFIKKKHVTPIEKIQYYNASFQTPIEGRVGSFVADFITKLIEESETSALSGVAELMNNKKDYFEIKS